MVSASSSRRDRPVRRRASPPPGARTPRASWPRGDRRRCTRSRKKAAGSAAFSMYGIAMMAVKSKRATELSSDCEYQDLRLRVERDARVEVPRDLHGGLLLAHHRGELQRELVERVDLEDGPAPEQIVAARGSPRPSPAAPRSGRRRARAGSRPRGRRASGRRGRAARRTAPRARGPRRSRGSPGAPGRERREPPVPHVHAVRVLARDRPHRVPARPGSPAGSSHASAGIHA